MLSRYRMLGLLCLDNQERPICLGPAEHAPRHSESFPGQPCAMRGEVRKNHPVSAALTMPLALPKSICPAYFAFKALITLPMSFIPAAPVSAIAAAIAALTSASDIC